MKIIDILTKIWSYLLTSKGQRNILIVILALFIIYFKSCGGSKTDTSKYEQNIAALTDSLRTYKDKNGQLVYEKNAFIASEKELKNLNKDLADQIKYIKDHPIVVVQWKVKIVHDTVYVNVGPGIPQYKDSGKVVVTFPWNSDTIYSPSNFRNIGGVYTIEADTGLNVKTKTFMISKDELGMSFTTGLTESKDDKLEIFIKSPYPGFKPIDVQGALIDPTESDVIKKFFPPKRWSVGPYIGYGAYYDPIQLKVGTGVTVGISITYGVFQWKGKK